LEELILKAQTGDVKAFSELILLINDDLYKIAKSRISNEEDVQDAVQETMIECFKSIKKLHDPDKFKKWIITILINKSNRIYRRKYKKDISYEEINMDSFYTSSSITINSQSNIGFYELLKDLKYEERIIVILYYMEDYSVKDIKEILKMRENTINTHLFRARKKIKKIIEDGGILNG